MLDKSPDVVAALEKHAARKARHIKVGDYDFVLVPASEEAYDRFTDVLMRSPSSASQALIVDCVVHPTGPQLDAIFAHKPAIKTALSRYLQHEAGGSLAIVEGK